KIVAQFGNWIVTDSDCIDRAENAYPDVYPIAFSEISDASRVVGKLAHMLPKTWMTPEEIGNLVKAMDRAVCLVCFVADPRVPCDDASESGGTRRTEIHG